MTLTTCGITSPSTSTNPQPYVKNWPNAQLHWYAQRRYDALYKNPPRLSSATAMTTRMCVMPSPANQAPRSQQPGARNTDAHQRTPRSSWTSPQHHLNATKRPYLIPHNQAIRDTGAHQWTTQPTPQLCWRGWTLPCNASCRIPRACWRGCAAARRSSPQTRSNFRRRRHDGPRLRPTSPNPPQYRRQDTQQKLQRHCTSCCSVDRVARWLSPSPQATR